MSLLELCPLDGRYSKSPKFDDLREIFSEFGLLKHRLFIEVKWLIYLANLGSIKNLELSAKNQEILEDWCKNFDLQEAEKIKEIEKTTNHDVKALEYFIQDKFATLGLERLNPFIHFACTSEDINNLAYALMLKKGREVLFDIFDDIDFILTGLTGEFKNIAILTKTHGQPATPSTMGKEIYNFVYRLQRAKKRITKVEILGKFNGAVGNYNAHVVAYPNLKWNEINQKFVESLSLSFNPFTTQIEPHDFVAELMDSISSMNNILLDLARDIWLYVSFEYFNQRVKKDEVGSSTMPHKVNPIDFENAEGNIQVANAIADMLSNKLPISRLQRDLSDSTVMRNLGLVFGYSILAMNSLLKGLHKLQINEKKISEDLEKNIEVLTEAVQMVLRKYGISDAYDRLKVFSRGKKLSLDELHLFIDEQPIDDGEKSRLKLLTPATYLGLAKELF